MTHKLIRLRARCRAIAGRGPRDDDRGVRRRHHGGLHLRARAARSRQSPTRCAAPWPASSRAPWGSRGEVATRRDLAVRAPGARDGDGGARRRHPVRRARPGLLPRRRQRRRRPDPVRRRGTPRRRAAARGDDPARVRRSRPSRPRRALGSRSWRQRGVRVTVSARTGAGTAPRLGAERVRRDPGSSRRHERPAAPAIAGAPAIAVTSPRRCVSLRPRRHGRSRLHVVTPAPASHPRRPCRPSASRRHPRPTLPSRQPVTPASDPTLRPGRGRARGRRSIMACRSWQWCSPSRRAASSWPRWSWPATGPASPPTSAQLAGAAAMQDGVSAGQACSIAPRWFARMVLRPSRARRPGGALELRVEVRAALWPEPATARSAPVPNADGRLVGAATASAVRPGVSRCVGC